MSRHPRRDTDPELRLRRQLHALGLRYRVDCRPLPDLRRTADLVFRGEQVAVFVDGCFWHGCSVHGVQPKTNTAWWRAKIARTQNRDRDTTERLTSAGWEVLRFWEHEPTETMAAQVVSTIQRRRQAR